ncbi:hypothetical protein CO044_01535 [Candidatus Peregrinibacteria bacterium CG_4_9_14_0_2_um_filter_38_9]|nr:MAG: hypothetical protein CO044_01535 [Candidatus Peregrinibacteria bacterium CG_4_9_14_0_2_um_filter_38_9]
MGAPGGFPEGQPEAQAEAAKKAPEGVAATQEKKQHAEKFKNKLGGVGNLYKIPIDPDALKADGDATKSGQMNAVAGPNGSAIYQEPEAGPAQPLNKMAAVPAKPENVPAEPEDIYEKAEEEYKAEKAAQKAKANATAAELAKAFSVEDVKTTTALAAKSGVETPGIAGETPDFALPEKNVDVKGPFAEKGKTLADETVKPESVRTA